MPPRSTRADTLVPYTPLFRSPKPGDRHEWLTSVPEIDVLQRLLDVQPLDEGDRRLKVVDLLAADAQLVALDGRLHLHLGVLDRLDQAPGQILGDALPDHDGLPQRIPGRLLRRLELQRTGIDLAAREVPLPQLMHLLQLQVVVGQA